MLRIYGLIIVLGLLAGVGYGAYYYYNDTQERLATLRDSNAKLEVANKQNQATIQAMKDNYKKQQELNNELTAKLVKAEQYGNALRKKLSKIDLPKDFLTKWIQLNSEKKITLDEAKLEYEKSEKGMKYQLIESKIIIQNNLQVNFDDLKKYTSDLIKTQMQQYGQSVTDEKNIEQTVARVMSNKDEVKRLTEQLSGERILNFFKENISYKSKKLTYDQFIKEAYQV